MAEFRVMTFNVQNLFPARHEFGPRTQSEFNAKIQSLAAVIEEAKPHVVGLQELGSEAALTALQDQLSTHRLRHRALSEPDSRGIRVGFISSRVLNDPTMIQMFPKGLLPVQSGDSSGVTGPETRTGISRAALQVRVRANGSDVHIVNCHLKSKLLTFPNRLVFVPNDEGQRTRFGAYAMFRRASEAATLRTHLTALMNNSGETEPFVLLGDLNDETEAATTQILNGPPGSELGTIGFARRDNGDTSRLFNLAPLLRDEQRFSRIYRGRHELIDHIFVSRFLADPTRSPTMTQHLATPALPSINDDPEARRNDPGSDHAALMATFNW